MVRYTRVNTISLWQDDNGFGAIKYYKTAKVHRRVTDHEDGQGEVTMTGMGTSAEGKRKLMVGWRKED